MPWEPLRHLTTASFARLFIVAVCTASFAAAEAPTLADNAQAATVPLSAGDPKPAPNGAQRTAGSIIAYLAAGVPLLAVTGFMQTAYGGASTTTVGELMELDAVAACVICGTSLRGGRGTALGALMMAMLLNGMTLLAVSLDSSRS